MTEQPDALAVVLDELQRMRDRLDVIEQRHADEDHPEAALLRALDASIGDHEFSCCEVIAHAERVDPVLRARLLAIGADNPRKLGCLFARIEDLDCGGLTVFRLDEDRDGIIWRVRVSS